MKQQHFIERVAGAMGQEVNWTLEEQFMDIQFPKWVAALNTAYDRVWRAWPWSFARQREADYELTNGAVPWAKLAGGHWVQCSLPADGSSCRRVLAGEFNALGFQVFNPPEKVLLQYMTAPPVFANDIWNSGGTYNAGALVYNHTRGDTFKALVNAPGSNFDDAAKWERYQVLDQLVPVLLHFTKGDYLRGEGQHAAADLEYGLAESALDEALLRERQPKQVY